MKCRNCGHGEFLKIVGGEYDDERMEETVECEGCGNTGTVVTDKQSFEMTGSGGILA